MDSENHPCWKEHQSEANLQLLTSSYQFGVEKYLNCFAGVYHPGTPRPTIYRRLFQHTKLEQAHPQNFDQFRLQKRDSNFIVGGG